ncbi:MAG TPA: ATP-binding protein [Actinomycetota bacterium]|jgi:heavy metal sensor kinase
MRPARALARLPIRLRLLLAFVAVMAAVIFAIGVFLYARVGAALDRTIDQSLRARADDVVALVHRAGPGPWRQGRDGPEQRGESFAQVLDHGGAVVDSSGPVGDRPLLGAAEAARAAATTVTVPRRRLPGSDDPARLLATPAAARDGRRYVVVVGASLEGRGDALESLVTQLLIGGPLALLLSSLAGWGLATAALRPVESMRREAEAVSAAEPGRRLTLPPTRDEVARLGATLNGMLGRLEVALARERRFVSDASHELRTPLAALRTELELALWRERTPQELEGALRSAAEETERLSHLAEDLLVLARSERGTLPVQRQRLEAAELLADVQARYSRRAAQAGRRLEVGSDAELVLFVDRLRAEQALGNLVENALRHGRGRILVRAARNNGRVELRVRDQGPGFPPEFVAHAFDPFSRGDPARPGSGAGLGLSIVDVIARAHGGVAHAENRDGGAEVWLDLPDERQGVRGAEERGPNPRGGWPAGAER